MDEGGICELTSEAETLNWYAVMIIIVYAVLVPCLFFWALWRQREDLRADRETEGTRAIAFMHSPYVARFWYFEVVEILRKLFLVGFATLFPPGSLVQLIWALMPAIFALVIQMQMRPFRSKEDELLAMVASLATIFTLIMCMALRIGSIIEDLEQSDMEETVWSFLRFDVGQVLVLLFTSSLAVFGAVVVLGYISLRDAKLLPHLFYRSKEAKLEVLGKRARFHLFFVRAESGLRQAGDIALSLREMLPGVHIKQEVANDAHLLNERARVMHEMDVSRMVVVMISRGVFLNHACLDQLVHAFENERLSVGGDEESGGSGDGASVASAASAAPTPVGASPPPSPPSSLGEGSYKQCSTAGENEAPAAAAAAPPPKRVLFVQLQDQASLREDEAVRELLQARKVGEVRWNLACENGDVESGAWGGWPLPYKGREVDDVRFEWIKDRVVEKLRESIEWHSESRQHQQIGLLDIAEHIIVKGEAHHREDLDLPDGPLSETVQLPRADDGGGGVDYHVYCSPSNAGGFDVIYDELRHLFDDSAGAQLQIACTHAQARQGECVRVDGESEGAAEFERASGRGSASSAVAGDGDGADGARGSRRWRMPRLSRRSVVDALRRSSHRAEKAPSATGLQPSSRRGSTVFVLYLNGLTWKTAQSKRLAEEVLAQLEAAERAGVSPRLLLLHERDESNSALHAVPFASFFAAGSTPNVLIQKGLFNVPAIPLLHGQLRRLSLLEAAERLLALYERPSEPLEASRWLEDASRSGVSGVEGGTSTPGQAEILLRHRINGIDDDDDLEVSPVVGFYSVSKGKESGADGGARGRVTKAVFTSADETRHVTIKRYQVLVDGVERRVRWGRTVERSVAERFALLSDEEKARKKGKQLQARQWEAWEPFPRGADALVNATIERVDPQLDGLVHVRTEEGTAHNFLNPQKESAALGLVAVGPLSSAALASKSKSNDRLHEALSRTAARVSQPEIIGSRDDFSSHSLALDPERELPLSLVRELRHARHLWRIKRAGPQGGSKTRGHAVASTGSAAATGVIDLEVKNADQLREALAKGPNKGGQKRHHGKARRASSGGGGGTAGEAPLSLPMLGLSRLSPGGAMGAAGRPQCFSHREHAASDVSRLLDLAAEASVAARTKKPRALRAGADVYQKGAGRVAI
jgi:hypothetical protein